MPLPTIVVMGVSGCGKSTVGAALAARMGRAFVDADDLHPEENRRLMAASIPLGDVQRWPWLRRVAGQIAQWEQAGAPGVIACSALKRSYRDYLRAQSGASLLFVHLDPAEAVLASRLSCRTGHFMPPGLLASQLEALERPDGTEAALVVTEEAGVDALCAMIEAGLSA